MREGEQECQELDWTVKVRTTGVQEDSAKENTGSGFCASDNVPEPHELDLVKVPWRGQEQGNRVGRALSCHEFSGMWFERQSMLHGQQPMMLPLQKQ